MANIKFTFEPKLIKLGDMPAKVDADVIEREPMLCGASLGFAQRRAGPLLTKLLAKVDLNEIERIAHAFGVRVQVDTRVQMLGPGMYPAIPGWHCDFTPRTKSLFLNSSPKADKEQIVIQPAPWCIYADLIHITCFVSNKTNGVSRTKYIAEDFKALFTYERPTWEQLHEQLEANYKGKIVIQKEGEIMQMNSRAIHAAQPASTFGWRWWARIGMTTDKPKNKVRKQIQIYTTEGGGW